MRQNVVVARKPGRKSCLYLILINKVVYILARLKQWNLGFTVVKLTGHIQ